MQQPQTIPTSSSSSSNSRRCNRHQSTNGRSESVLSTDSDIRFTRRKLGDSQRCGCVVIAGFLLLLLLAGAAVYVGCKYFHLLTHFTHSGFANYE